MHISITVAVPDDLQDPDHVGTDLTAEAYDQLVEALNDLGYEDVSVSRGF